MIDGYVTGEKCNLSFVAKLKRLVTSTALE